MGTNSKIEWTDHTFNPWLGCSKVSPACTNCYAEAWAKRSGLVKWGDGAERRRTSEANWKEPLKWNEQARREGVRRRVFCASLADVFEDRGELVQWRNDLFVMIEKTPYLDWLLLTKRPHNVLPKLEAIRKHWLADKLPLFDNIWIGATVENQEMADKRIPELIQIPAAIHFLSCEPLLGPIDLSKWMTEGGEPVERDGSDDTPPGVYDPILQCHVTERFSEIDWVIIGGESGPNARPSHPDWFRSLRDQCKAASVAFYFKQHGDWLHCSQAKRWKDTQVADWDFHGAPSLGFGPDRTYTWPEEPWSYSHRVGKKAAGRMLDHVEWNQMPMLLCS